MAILTQAQFIKRFAENSGIMQKDAKQYLEIIKDEITRSLVKGYEVRLYGIGNLKRAKFPSKTMPNPNDRSKQLLILDRYYMRIKPSPQFKLKIKAKIFPDKYRLPTPKPKIKPDKDAKPIKIHRSYFIPIRVRPTIPPISWRKPLSGVMLDLRRANPTAQDRLLKNLFRRASAPQMHGISIDPNEINYYGQTSKHEDINETLYKTIIDSMQAKLPQAFLTPQTWRLLVALPPRELFNFTAAPTFGDRWLVRIIRPRSLAQNLATQNALPPATQKIIDKVLAGGSGRILIFGDKLSRHITIDKIRQYLVAQNIGHHYGLEHHYHPTHPHINFAGALKDSLTQAKLHKIMVLNDLSAADNLYHINKYPGIVIASIAADSKRELDNILRLQQIPSGFFTAIIESHRIAAACPQCMPAYQPAVRFPHMRRLAAQRNMLLHVHPVRVRICQHENPPHLINTIYSDTAKDIPSLENQLFDMALKHNIDYNAIEENLK